MVHAIKDVLRDDRGATMVEYSIMASLIAAVCIAVVGTLGTNVNTAFANLNSSL